MDQKFNRGDVVVLNPNKLFILTTLNEWAKAGSRFTVVQRFASPTGDKYSYDLRRNLDGKKLCVTGRNLLPAVPKPLPLVGPKPEPTKGPLLQTPFRAANGFVYDANDKLAFRVPVSVSTQDNVRQIAEEFARLVNRGVEAERADAEKAVTQVQVNPFEDVNFNAPW